MCVCVSQVVSTSFMLLLILTMLGFYFYKQTNVIVMIVGEGGGPWVRNLHVTIRSLSYIYISIYCICGCVSGCRRGSSGGPVGLSRQAVGQPHGVIGGLGGRRGLVDGRIAAAESIGPTGRMPRGTYMLYCMMSWCHFTRCSFLFLHLMCVCVCVCYWFDWLVGLFLRFFKQGRDQERRNVFIAGISI